MSYPVDSLEPKALWKYFDKIRAIPHGSKDEQALGEAIQAWAKERGCESDTDETGNVVVKIAATPGLENAPTVVLQGHIDMVCEKNSDKDFDFEKDSIVLVRDGDWILADGTTLGADNGIGVATALAFMDVDDAPHGPLEVLMTVDEETGLGGALGLKPGFITGTMMFNMDSEEDGVFYVGCAGGRDTEIELPITKETTPGGVTALNVEVKGLRGGHSGLDIIQNRGNAIRLVMRALKAVSREVNIGIADVFGGDKHNAIPREAKALITVPKGSEDKVKAILDTQYQGYREEFASAEADVALLTSAADMPKVIMSPKSMTQTFQLLLGLPHGVLAMVRGLDGLVETSSNMARVRVEEGAVTLLCSSRSPIASAVNGVADQIEAVGTAAGAKVETDEGYPGWKPNMESKMLAKAKEVWKTVHGEDAEFTVIHAGLECGIIGEKYPGMDMISLGPTIVNPHSPEERVSIPTVERFFTFTKAFLKSLAE